MSRLGNFDGIDNLDNPKAFNNPETPSSTNVDRKKLERKIPDNIRQSTPSHEELDSNKVRKLSDREKIAYYKSNGLNNLANNRNAILRNNEGNSDNHRLTKLNSHNYDKLAETRNRTLLEAQNEKESFAKWSPDAKEDKSLQNHSVLAKHASEGEKGKVAHNKGEKASGEYIAKSHAQTPEKIIEHAALPPRNRAEQVSNIELARPQNIVIGQAGPQKQFECDGIPRSGGTRQIITDGGYKNGAIRDIHSEN